ncbi:MAG TPA: ABC transporter substrate-binding protein [Gemmatimonadota bacterium]|nr:ABC transporter substrate-binding protein [Gemmatimonadota bacterium]
MPGRPRRLAGAVVVSILAGACGATPATDADQESTLTILHLGADLTFGAQHFTPAKFLVFEPMAWLDREGRTVPRLARAWSHSPDFREWTYHLRTDARWHDGVPVTSRDVKWTVERFARPDIAYYWDLEEVLAPDDSTVVIRTSRPRGEPDAYTVYYPEHLLRDLDPDLIWEWEFWKRPVGNGPFRFSRRVPLTLWEFEPNADYYGGRPVLDRVRVRVGGGDPLVELRSGNVDALVQVDRALLPKIERDARFRAYYEVQNWSDAIWWNQRHPFLAEVAVRRALTHAIDRRELQRLLELPEFLPIADVPLDQRQLLRDDLPPPYAFDPGEAARLLDAAGWRDGDGDGIRERRGVRAAFTALAGPGSDFAAVYVREALLRVGVAMEIQLLPDAPRRQVAAGEFEAAFDRFIPAQTRWFGGLGYENDRMRGILAAIDTAADPAIRASLSRELWPDFLRDLPLTLLGPQVTTYVAHRRVHGLSTPWGANPYEQAPWIWLEEEE